ncbi:urease, partial [Micromonospora chalcea]
MTAVRRDRYIHLSGPTTGEHIRLADTSLL